MFVEDEDVSEIYQLNENERDICSSKNHEDKSQEVIDIQEADAFYMSQNFLCTNAHWKNDWPNVDETHNSSFEMKLKKMKVNFGPIRNKNKLITHSFMILPVNFNLLFERFITTAFFNRI